MALSTGIASRRKMQESTACVMTFKVGPDMRKAIRLQAVEEELDVSELIRRAVLQYLTKAQ